MNIRKTSALVTLGLCSLVGVVAYRVGRARADGVPTASPLYYGGVLDDGGRPVEGMRNVTIRLWDMASGGTATCTTVAPNTPFAAGRFRVEMDPACAAAVRTNPNLWAEVLVDSTTFARTKLGAVPYALEAGRAAGASGALEGRIAAVEALAQPRQVESGGAGGSATYQGSGSGATSEIALSGATLTFTPRSTGTFLVSANCVITGQASISIRTLSTPAPTGFQSSPASASLATEISNGLSRMSSTVQVEARGTFRAATPYTLQIIATLTSIQYRCSPCSWSTSEVQCDRIVVTQLN